LQYFEMAYVAYLQFHFIPLGSWLSNLAIRPYCSMTSGFEGGKA
jgi:hypothetical protein